MLITSSSAKMQLPGSEETSDSLRSVNMSEHAMDRVIDGTHI